MMGRGDDKNEVYLQKRYESNLIQPKKWITDLRKEIMGDFNKSFKKCFELSIEW